ncbi:hypothetical protein [Sinomicrobium weinanense]|uniref:DUF3568 family protein n=1 Tax=Sinomicrobium weinanense TaxID=2842200 RepID=A0A926JUZ6_9FLAO|nr:hypothetical protein [Sinomicrobium weinanense]MBC9798047.1 hypothetical protein [Sinomicrobium weinanense]MBU3124859.1 hypothetical protein [Sinomicrobium weinanense]
MKIKAVLFFLALLVLTSCAIKQEVSEESTNRMVYKTTLNKGDYEEIYRLLKSEFPDFPERRKKVVYSRGNQYYTLKINLKKNKFGLVYQNSGGQGVDDKVESVRSKIEAITE